MTNSSLVRWDDTIGDGPISARVSDEQPMNCTDCQKILGADPRTGEPGVKDHVVGCARCASFETDMVALNDKLLKATKIDVPMDIHEIDFFTKTMRACSAPAINIYTTDHRAMEHRRQTCTASIEV